VVNEVAKSFSHSANTDHPDLIGSSRAEPLTVSAALHGGSLQIAGSEVNGAYFWPPRFN
jgi:hypothetical protein